MISGSTIRRCLLAISIAITGVLPGAVHAAAQDDPRFEPDSYQTLLTGEDIRISGKTFTIVDVLRQNYPDGENEQVFISGNVDDAAPANIEVTFIDDSDTPDETIDLWVEGLAQAEGIDELQVVDAGLDDNVYWYYVTASIEDHGFVFYIQVTENVQGKVDMLESVLTIDGALVDVVKAAQGEIKVGDGTFMDDVELDDLDGLVNGKPFRDSKDENQGS